MLLTGHRARTALAGLSLGCVAALTGCSVVAPSSAATAPTGRAGRTGSTSTPSPSTTPSAAAVLTPSIASGRTDVAVDTVVKVRAAKGTVADVKMTYRDTRTGATVPVQGTLDPAGSSWTAASLLEPGSSYDLAMTGKNVDGATTTTRSAFTTQKLSLKEQIFPTIVGGGTVGVAMPVIVRFDVPVTDRASIQRHLKVTSSPSQPGTWSWLSNNEVHYRPATYWKPGTTVTVDVDINSVPAGNGTYGQTSVTGGFTVGRSVVMKADLATDQMSVVIDGKVARTIPVTGGKAGFLSRSGTKVIMEKFAQLRMDANTVGIEPGDPNYYDIPAVKFAMRETNSGEFLHAAPWSVASQGKANVSHGCVGMSTDNAGWLFSQVRVGDPVVVTGTTRSLEQGNGWTDWNVSYPQYQKGSAL
ncbi:MAG: Ig-like domain-containing protein [Actinomycetota bacterium]|nr:Ig-like domain-containing protein [Actinomycetota bacterium]